MKSTDTKRIKQVIIFALTVALVLPLFLSGLTGHLQHVQAKTDATRWFSNQLTEKEMVFYNALDQMYNSGMLKTGTENLDLTDILAQDDLESYANGNPDLLSWMGAARDAFYFDHADIFYVDFSALSLRVTVDTDGKYHAYLGTGRRANYFTEGFNSKEQVEAAIAEYDAVLDKIVKEANGYKVDSSMDRIKALIIWTHNYVTSHTTYQLENTCQPENISLIRTAYGSLVRGESACEGYARAVKAILDRLEIPCVLVQGVYLRTANQPELHMWNYVQLNGKWYGLDATMDDPIGGSPTTEYLLRGDDIMSARHVSNGIVSPVDREFEYPALVFASEGYEEIQNTNGLVVEYKTDMFEGISSGYFRVSYQGMGYAEAAKHGKYILTRLYTYELANGDDPEKYSYVEWFYADPSIYQINSLQTKDALILPLPQCVFAEFAVTDIAPNLPDDLADFDIDKHDYFFHGDPLLFEAQSKLIYNPEGTYVAPPYPERVLPVQTSRMVMENTYDMSFTYNDKLIQVDGMEPGYILTSTGPTALANSKIENFHWDGDRTITFRFTPSKMYADESVYYYFNITGLVGEKSQKAPVEVSYAVSSGIPPHGCVLCGDYNWKVFGKPSLLETGDLSMSDWVTSDGSAVSDLLKNRLALVVTDTNKKQTESINELIGEENQGHEILASTTYNITLTLCRQMVIKTGQSVKVSLGFPEGYGPEDEGVTFKAYHFIKDAADNVIGVEELPCVVTKFGLIITCNAFSPFAIAVVEGEEETTERTVVFSNSFGGKLYVNGRDSSDIVTLQEGEKISVTAFADNGYYVNKVTVGGYEVTGIETEWQGCTFELSYDTLQDGVNIVEPQFIASIIQEADKESGETDVQPAPDNILVNGETPDPDRQIPDSLTAEETNEPPAPAPTQSPAATQPPAQAPQGSTQTPQPSATQAPAAQASQPPATQAPAQPPQKTPDITKPSGSTSVASSNTGKVGSAVITFSTSGATLALGDRLVIEPKVELPVGINSYQWYKDGTALSGQTSRNLIIESVSSEDAGVYYLYVKSTVESDSYETTSPEYTVTVTDSQAQESPVTTDQPEETGADTDVIISANSAPNEKESGSNPVLPIILLVLAVAALGVVAFYVISSRRNSDDWR